MKFKIVWSPAGGDVLRNLMITIINNNVSYNNCMVRQQYLIRKFKGSQNLMLIVNLQQSCLSYY